MPSVFDRFSARDIAIAVAASNRLMIEHLFSDEKREALEQAFLGKSQELTAEQHETGAGHLLLILGGVMPAK